MSTVPDELLVGGDLLVHDLDRDGVAVRVGEAFGLIANAYANCGQDACVRTGHPVGGEYHQHVKYNEPC